MISRAWIWLVGSSALLVAGAAAGGSGGAAPTIPTTPPKNPESPKTPTPSKGPLGGPPFSISGRSKWIEDAARSEEVSHSWAPITLTDGGSLRGRLDVSADDLRVGNLRVSADANTTELIAEMLGGMLATSKIVDEVWKQSSRTMNPLPTKWYQDSTPDGNMASTPRMIEYSGMVDAKLGSGNGLASNTGKWWILSRRLWEAGSQKKATNYGWHRSDGSVIQPIGLKSEALHNRFHVDYSQKLRFMRQTMSVSQDSGKTWETMKTADVLENPSLSVLLSNEGPLPGGEMP